MAKLSAAQLKALPDSMFGLPKTRQYPMPDKTHVIKAIQFFKYCKDADKPELAKNINRRAKELGMKIKVQPSSAFYKYADKAILKEATLVQEFHIGQLSPIVPIQPEIIKMNFGNGKDDTVGPIERLNKLWGSKKALQEKCVATFDIVNKAVHENHVFTAEELAILEGIDFMAYMQSQWSDNDNSFRFANRLFTRDAAFYTEIQDAIKDHRLDDIVNHISAMDSNTICACALAMITYTSDLTPEEKEYIIKKIPEYKRLDLADALKYGPNFDNATIITYPIKWDKSNNRNMSDDDIYNINTFINLITDQYRLGIVLGNITNKRFGDNCDIFIGNYGDSPMRDGCTIGVKAEIDLFDYVRNTNDIGYYRKQIDRGFYDFIKIDKRIYVVAYVYNHNDNKQYFSLMCIYDYDNDEYNKNMIAFVLGADIKFNIITRLITINKPKAKALEASDFTEVYRGLQLNTNGNVSFLMDELESWPDKLSLCAKMLSRNMKDNEYEQYKNNLCALFTLINLVYNKYNPSLMDDSAEAKSALSVMDRAIVLFKDSIAAINKIQPEFKFVEYYISQHYNDKVEVFKVMDPDELKQAATIAYRWIVAG